MGAWGNDLLANDSVLDWLGEFSDNPTDARLTKALTQALDDAESVEQNIAVIAVVGLRHGFIVDDIEPDLIRWAAKVKKPLPQTAIDHAMTIAKAALIDEDFAACWHSPSDYQSWQNQLEKIIHALSKPRRAIEKDDIPKISPTFYFGNERYQLESESQLQSLFTGKVEDEFVMEVNWGDWQIMHLQWLVPLLQKAPQKKLIINRERRSATLPDTQLIEFIQQVKPHNLQLSCSGFAVDKALKELVSLQRLTLKLGDKKQKFALAFLAHLTHLCVLRLTCNFIVLDLAVLTELHSLKGLQLSIADYQQPYLPELPSGLEELNFRCHAFRSKPQESFDIGAIYRCSTLKRLTLAVASENHEFRFEQLAQLEFLFIDDQSSHHPWCIKNIEWLRPLTQLKALILHCIKPTSFEPLSALPHLQALDCWNSGITSLSQLPNVNQLSHLVIKQLGQTLDFRVEELCPSIKYLELPNISDPQFLALSQLEELTHLSCVLSGSHLTETDIAWLKKLASQCVGIFDNLPLQEIIFGSPNIKDLPEQRLQITAPCWLV